MQSEIGQLFRCAQRISHAPTVTLNHRSGDLFLFQMSRRLNAEAPATLYKRSKCSRIHFTRVANRIEAAHDQISKIMIAPRITACTQMRTTIANRRFADADVSPSWPWYENSFLRIRKT